MSKNFSSIVKLVNPSGGSGREEEITTQTRSTTGESTLLQWDTRTVTLPAIQPLPLSAQRPEQLQPARFWFDRVFSSSDTQVDIYKKAVKDIVESCLLGYHGTVISFGTTGVQIELDMRAEKEDFVICKAAEQIFRCLKKSRQSESRSSTSNLVMLCSSVIITHEKVYDLLFGYPSTVDDELPPELSLVNGRVLGASQLKVKGGKVAPLLRYGREVERRILDYRKSLNVQDQGAYHGSGRTHHKVFTLSVEYSQFGSMNSPVSGNLMFVDVAPSDPLTNRQRHTIGDEIAPGYLSLFTLADIVNSLTPNTAIVEGGVGSSGSTYDVIDEVQSSQLPCVPETTSKELYQNSVLTQLLQDSLGGNCKTLLMSYVPELVLPIRYGELYETLKLASRARLIQNAPNKRDLAEKALMSAYMRGLQEMYGQGVLAKREEKKPQKRRMPPSFVTPFNEGADATSISSDEIDTAYDEMINITGEKRQQNVEMAATALVAAALEDKEDDDQGDISSGGGESSDGDTSSDNSESKPGHSEGAAPLQAKVRLKKKKLDPRRAALMEGGILESASVSSLTERDVTIDALINIIQDPDKGVPRPPVSALKDVQVRQGSVFSGAELVRWMVNNIDGVENETNAEILGQLLLDKGALLHSEGSKVFANAETLFYYTAFARPTKKLLSLEEIMRLLAQATDQPEVQDGDVRRNVTIVHGGEENQTNVEEMTVTEVDGEEPEGNGLDRDRMVGNDTGMPQQETETGFPREGTIEARQEESYVVGQEMLLQDIMEGEIPEINSTHHDDAQCHDDDGDRQASANFESYLQTDDEVEQAQADLLKKQEEDLGQPNTAAQEHIPSVQTLEKTTDYPHPLHMAVAIGKSSGVVKQLVMMFGVNKRDEYHRTPLMFAALGNNKSSSCNTLIECGAEVDQQDICGLTALHVACYHGNRAAASVLLSKKASVCLFDNTDHSVYHWSTVPDDDSCLQLLMSFATPELVMYADRWGLTALHWAICYDHSQHLKLLLKMCKEPLKQDSEGRTFLTYAMQQQAAQCIKVLLAAYPSLLMAADAKEAYPLHHASVQKSPGFLELFLSYKLPKKSKVSLDINCKNRSGRTPLHCAVAYNQLQNVILLVSRGAQVGAADDEGRTCLDYANDLGEGDREIVLAALQNKLGAEESSKASTHASSKVCITL